MGEISFSFEDYSVERIGRVTDEWEKLNGLDTYSRKLTVLY